MNDTIQELKVTAFRIPTDLPESDGTLEWNDSTLVWVRLGVGGVEGLGYSYTHACCVPLIRETLFPIVQDSIQGHGSFSIRAEKPDPSPVD